jgi:hypothetical protein
MHFLIDHLVSERIKKIFFFSFINSFFLVSQNRKSSASKQRNDLSLLNDNFPRQELTSWLLPSEKQQQQNHRPFSEINENNRNNRLRTLSDENELFMNRRQTTIIG